ncbi:MAG: hypothetical protein L0170_17745, partial [Acidobacteria bacterium]|nr:hypothetical protein [Acidobacteriota bacterium]
MQKLPRTVSHVKTDALSEAEQRKHDRARERETYTYFNDYDELRVSTCHEWVASELHRRGARLVKESGGGRQRPKCWIFEAPRGWFKVPGPPPKRTEKQRKAARNNCRRRAAERAGFASTPTRLVARVIKRDAV